MIKDLVTELESVLHDCIISSDCKECPYVDHWGSCMWKDILGKSPVDWKLTKLHRYIKE